ncbi:TVP38/TMEM64 family protein [Alicyclobacillus fastidiosus]|uniref:TVP38/TMEM64 family membrane protein n=1 Tax=Alicyclobacillus fastidiosus TaxID=392011 RepID=A0ABV5ACA4_9BACL|nr:VTT domain-containing protein [Alicyclobacillus fastidiosus]WEH11402.1 VTT domain-containing protein [Alicyclobacillus fastidiosus]
MDTEPRSRVYKKRRRGRDQFPLASTSRKTGSVVSSAVVILVFALLIVLFFRLDRSDELSRVIHSTGLLGILIAVVLMAVLSILPLPSEFLMIVIMKIFGPWWGILLSWIGTMTAAIVTFLLARHLGRKLLSHFISEDRFEQISNWIGNRGAVGLIMVRIIPFPFIVVNYAAGVLRGIRLRDFIWTSAVGGIPYYIGAALVFLGVSKRYVTWLIVGGVALVVVWIAGYLFNRHVQLIKRFLH